MAYEEDIKSRSFWDWVKAHTSFMKPLHRYEGVLELNENKIIFRGRDVKENKNFDLEVEIEDIVDVYFGFDDTFRGREDRAYPWNKPLRVRYKSKEGEKTIYLFANFHHKYGMRTSDNEEVYKKLKLFYKGFER